MKFALTKNDGADLGFAQVCLIASAITLDEFKEWIYHVIELSDIDDVPSYMFDFLDIELKTDLYRVVHFVPCDGLKTQGENHAVDGIAFVRKHRDDKSPVYDEVISRKAALKALRNNPQILMRFERAFPFVSLNKNELYAEH